MLEVSRVCVAALVFSSALSVAGCSDDPTASDEYAILEHELAQSQLQLAALEAERDQLKSELEDSGGEVPPFDLDVFAAAWGSGDADKIRAFYTDDAVMMPFGHILSTLGEHPVPEYWDVAGPDMDREAFEHEGGTFEFLTMNRIGNMVVATGQWAFPEALDPALADTVIQTADIWHLRDNKIWRLFSDFEVYVDGDLIDM
jgi:ketosteroid isomerase-like protein